MLFTGYYSKRGLREKGSNMINVGDKVRLTGEEWGAYGGVHPGDIVKVTGIDKYNIWAGAAGTVGNPNGLYSESNPEPSGDYSCELVTDTPAEHFAKTAAKFANDTLSTEDIEQLKTLGEQLGISSFEQNVRRITDQIADLLIAKNRAYGDAALNPIRVFSKSDRMEGLYQRIDDKLSRVARGSDYPGDDTVLDLMGYLCLLMIARESE